MAAEDGGTIREDPALERLMEPPRPTKYPVARSASDDEVVNTIDIYGERPFSV
jgi:hypothetical protein